MENIKINEGEKINLQIAISSIGIVATNISLDNSIIKKSAQYKFNIDLGTFSGLTTNKISIVSSFLVATGNINQVIETTRVDYILKHGSKDHKIIITKQKINDNFFIVLAYIKLIKN